MKTRCIKVVVKAYPPQALHDTPATKEEIQNVARFTEAVQAAAKKYLLGHRSTVKIKEDRIWP